MINWNDKYPKVNFGKHYQYSVVLPALCETRNELVRRRRAGNWHGYWVCFVLDDLIKDHPSLAEDFLFIRKAIRRSIEPYCSYDAWLIQMPLKQKLARFFGKSYKKASVDEKYERRIRWIDDMISNLDDGAI